MNKKEREFIAELEKVSAQIATWAQSKIYHDLWSIEDCKIQIRNAMHVCGRKD